MQVTLDELSARPSLDPDHKSLRLTPVDSDRAATPAMIRLTAVILLAPHSIAHQVVLMKTTRAIRQLFFSALLFSSTPLFAEEIAAWNFDAEPAGWTANDQTELSIDKGSLKVRSKGGDPYFSTKVDGRAGNHRIVISAKFKGTADIQVFWTTEADPNTSEEKSVRGELRGSDKEFRSLKLHFVTDSPVTSLRIDPMSRKGEMQIDSIVLTDDAAPIPLATPVKDIKVAEGFEVELLHSVVSEKMGSWVCMTPDPKGRLIVSDQYGKLYRVTPPSKGSKDEIKIELIDVNVGMAQGCCVHSAICTR